MSLSSSSFSSLLSVGDHVIYYLNGVSFKSKRRYRLGQDTRPISIKVRAHLQASQIYDHSMKDSSFLTLFLPDLEVATLS